MHSYLRAIGFSEIRNKNQTDPLILQAISQPTSRIITSVSNTTSMVQINKEYGSDMGISIIGEYDEKGTLNIEHFYPYLIGNYTTHEEEIHIDKHSSNESYAGVCEDFNIGVSLIFYLQNIADYIRTKWLNKFADIPTEVKLTGLSTKGVIIYNVKETTPIRKNDKDQTSRNNLIAAARAGDVEALENLTIDDMDTYTIISRRSRHEDILSIVKTYFMPSGIETEQYSVLGEIIDVKPIINNLSNEKVYNIGIDCNNTKLNICINEKDLLGQPEVGRRFKGQIWLQGVVNIKF